MGKENLGKAKKSLLSKRNVVFTVSLAIALTLLVLIVNMYISNRKHLIDMLEKKSIESSLLRAANIILECKGSHGSIIKPINKYKGGGKICSMDIDSDMKNEWPSMPRIDGKYPYRYRKINDDEISGGTEEKDMVSCYYDFGIRCVLL